MKEMSPTAAAAAESNSFDWRDEATFHALLKLDVGSMICRPDYQEKWPVCSIMSRVWSVYFCAASFQESQFSKGKLCLALQRLSQRDHIFAKSTIMGSTTVFAREMRKKEEDAVKASVDAARAQEQLESPEPGPVRPAIATPQQRRRRPVKESLALLDARRAARTARKCLPPPGHEHRLLLKNTAAALELKKMLRKSSVILAVTPHLVHRYTVGLLKIGVRSPADILLHTETKLIYSADIKRSDVRAIIDFVRAQHGSQQPHGEMAPSGGQKVQSADCVPPHHSPEQGHGGKSVTFRC